MAALRRAIAEGERLMLPSLVIFEWLRGPRVVEEIEAQKALFPHESILPFGFAEAEISARLYKQLRRPRGREFDIAIAATTIQHSARLWTLNRADFADIPGLSRWEP